MKSKKLNILIILLGFTFFFTGCEEEEEPGKIFLRIDYVGLESISRYDDNNPGIPYNFTWGQYYECEAGSYNYEWEGVNLPGSTYPSSWCEGAIYRLNSVDGADRYYTLTLNSNGLCGEMSYY